MAECAAAQKEPAGELRRLECSVLLLLLLRLPFANAEDRLAPPWYTAARSPGSFV
jgi:hypothetical protein